MKKIIFITAAAMLIGGISSRAQETDNNITDDDNIKNLAQASQQINEGLQEIGTQMSTAIETTTKALGAALGEMMDGFAQMMTRAKICGEEDKKDPITLAQAEEIINAVIPMNSQNFKIDTTSDPQLGFASAEFQSNDSTLNVELSKSYCMLWLDEMTSSIKNMPDKIKQAVDKEVATNDASSNDDENIADETSESSYIIAGDSIAIEKFANQNINGQDIKLAVDEKKQNAYAFTIIGTLAIKARAHGDDAKDDLLEFFDKIDISKIKHILGDKSTEDIKAELNKKYDEAVKKLYDDAANMKDAEVIKEDMIVDE